MVAGKVKPAPPNTTPKPHNSSSKPPPLLISPPTTTTTTTTLTNSKHTQKTTTRPFGAYFPRASAQVQPRPPDATELLQLVQELKEKELRLRNELKHYVNVVPLLENEVSEKGSDIERFKVKVECLETENERLRNENEYLHLELSKQNQKYDERIRFMQNELADIKLSVMEKENDYEHDDDDEEGNVSSSSSSNTPRFVGLKSGKSLKSGFSVNSRKWTTKSSVSWKNEEVELKKEEIIDPSQELCLSSDGSSVGIEIRAPRVPKPPPMPSAAFLAGNSNIKPLIPSSSKAVSVVSPPPPPPPPPVKGAKQVPEKVRRVPEVVEFYHSLMRRDSNGRKDNGAVDGQGASVTTAKDMIGEIENRSAHLLAIKTDVETHGDLIRFLIKEVEGAAFTDIEDVVPFVKWLDDELSYLVDERAVLKHFVWPEQKADTLREAAFGYCDLKKLESEATSFRDDPKQHFGPALKKMQSLFEKLELGIYNLSRMRESASRRYKAFQIPSNWMLDTGFVSKIKLASVKLALKYMKRVLAELEMVAGGPEEEELIVQGVKFAFRVHQFAGGFDVETMKVFQELKDKSQMCNVQYQNQQQHKLVCRSPTSC